MNASVHRQLNRRKRRLLRRIENKPGLERHQPMMAASNIHYEIAEKARAIAPGGIGAIHLAPIPEPDTYVLMAAGLVVVLTIARRRRRA